MINYLKAFIIGSSWPVVIIPFILYFSAIDKPSNLKTYAIYAPYYIGIMNIVSLALQDIFQLSTQNRLILITLISSLLIIYIVKSNNIYNFSDRKWQKYYLLSLTLHFIIYNIIIYNMERIIFK